MKAFTKFDDPDQSFFTWDTVGSFAVMTVIISVFWEAITYKTPSQQLLVVSLITFAIMLTYALLSLDWDNETKKPAPIVIGRQIFLSIINSIYIIATVSGITAAINA